MKHQYSTKERASSCSLELTFPLARRSICCQTFIVLLAGLVSFTASASDVTEVLPVTDRILRVYIVDGHIDSYGPGETYQDNVAYVKATDIAKATTLSNYSVTSADDPYYASAKTPINLGRKSKAEDYNSQYQEVPYVWGHWIYLELPQALAPGKTYTVAFRDIVENQPSVTFTYDVNTLRSPTVHVNMVGFPASGPKYAYLSQWMGDFNSSVHRQGGLELDNYAGKSFRLINYATGATAFTGTVSKRLDKTTQETLSGNFAPEYNYSHADVWECKFSSFATPGEYVVAVDGLGCSYPFEIGNKITQEPFYYAMKGLFWQRQGIVKQMEAGKVMPRDHHPDDIPWKWDRNWPGSEDVSAFNTGAPRVNGIWGYYHDAGDWDGYPTHAKVPMLLCLLYDLSPEQFKDGEMDNRYKLSPTDANWIDESTNGLPDLLDEAGWLIKYFRRARTVLQNQYGGTGGVPGYVGRDALPENKNNITAWQDTREWYLSAENVEQTYSYAGLAAWYALCLNKFHRLTQSGNHPEYEAWLDEAQAAWSWAAGKTATTNDEKRARGFAAVNLYRTTGTLAYQSAFQEYVRWEPSKGDGEWGNPNIYDVALSVYSFIPANQAGLNLSLQNQCKSEIETKATTLKVDNLNANAFRCAMEKYQFFQLGPFSTPKLTLLPVAHKITGDPKYLEAIQNATNYVLGGNQLNLTYLSGLGEASDQWIFNPNGWLTNDYNSKVYSNEPFIGYTSYFGAVNFWFTNGINSEYWSREGSYPRANDSPNAWPEAESKFRNRYSIQGGEFTVHQQNNYLIYVMGYVKAMAKVSSPSYTLNARPTVSLSLNENASFPAAGADLTVAASSDVRRVAYYYEWHYIGESTDRANNFQLMWVPLLAPGTEVLVTAVGYDDRGRMTSPSDAGDKTVVIGASSPGGGGEENGASQFQQDDNGLVVMEAEHYSARAAGTGDLAGLNWDVRSDGEASQGQYARVDATGNNARTTLTGPRMDFNVSFVRSSTHYLWVRMIAPTPNDDSCLPAWDGVSPGPWYTGIVSSWGWRKYPISGVSPGNHTLSLYMREDGISIDKLLLTPDAGYTPPGTGPEETLSMASARTLATDIRSALDASSESLPEPKVYPNPLTAGELTLRLGTTTTGSLEVRDTLGRLLLTRYFSEQRQLTVRKEELAKGMLLLTIRTSSGHQKIKFLVE